MERARWRLGLAGLGVLIAAADTYVVVLALPAMMTDLGIPIQHLEQATPIVSGFLLGYITVLPLLGRVSDRAGRLPVLIACCAVFAFGSVMTASAHGLVSLVIGRGLQGLGGGGLVPVTLALVADLWPPGRRGLPLGAVSATQELGSVVGPLYGALVVSTLGWRAIFWINVPLALVIGGGEAVAGRMHAPRLTRRGLLAATLGALSLAAVLLAVIAPAALTDSSGAGVFYAPLVGSGGSLADLTAPVVIISAALALAAALVSLPALRRMRRPRIDAVGAVLVGAPLGCVVIAFAAADPAVAILDGRSIAFLAAAAVLIAALLLWERHRPDSLLQLRALRGRPAWGSLLANLALGTALMAAVVDVPIFGRTTSFPDSQLQAALVLARLLAAIPVGALLGGWLCERVGYRAVAAGGMLAAAIAFGFMTQWSQTVLTDSWLLGWLHVSDLELVVAGFGFGLAVSPLATGLLAAVPADHHGVAASLGVVARMVGMLVGLGVLTSLGLHAFYAAEASIPSAQLLCPTSPLTCPAYDAQVTGAALSELHTIFAGASVAALASAALAALTLQSRRAVRSLRHARVPQRG